MQYDNSQEGYGVSVATDNRQSVNREIRIALCMLRILFHRLPSKIAIRLWEGTEMCSDADVPETILSFNCPQAFGWSMLSRNPLVFAESYFRGALDIDGNIYLALQIRNYLTGLKLSLMEKAVLAAGAVYFLLRRSRSGQSPVNGWPGIPRQLLAFRSSREFNSNAVAFHYDVSNDFYRLWLGWQMVYSCAYFTSREQTLEQAQANKLDLICRKLRLGDGETLLDIGCGWGTLICWAAEKYGVRAHGITLSSQQLNYAQEQIRRRGLEDRVTVELRDYRDLPGENCYNKIVSVGMIEHVGLGNLPTYFAIAGRQLRAGGLFLNHGITMRKGGWRKSLGTMFINKYVFPDGQLETVSTIEGVMEGSGFEIHDVEGLRWHYAMTLREWVKRLEANHDSAIDCVDEATYRTWRLYMAGCAEQFEAGGIGIYQVLVSKQEQGLYPVPLTREDIYLPLQ